MEKLFPTWKMLFLKPHPHQFPTGVSIHRSWTLYLPAHFEHEHEEDGVMVISDQGVEECEEEDEQQAVTEQVIDALQGGHPGHRLHENSKTPTKKKKNSVCFVPFLLMCGWRERWA